MRVNGKAGTVKPRWIWTPRVTGFGGRLAIAHDGEDIQPFSSSFTALAGEYVSFREAAILTFSPLVGLRPSRSGVSLTLNFPNPGSEISSPFAAAPMMLFSMLSTIAWACDLLTPCASAIFVTSSDVFTSNFLDKSNGRALSHSVEAMSSRRSMTTRSSDSEIADVDD